MIFQSHKRRGIALMYVLVALSLLAVLMATITWQVVASHRVLDRRQHQQQSAWLARSGVELAVARLQADPAYSGEAAELIPLSEVKISVQKDIKADIFQVTSEARFPTDIQDGVVRSVTRQFRRVMEGGKVRLEAVKK